MMVVLKFSGIGGRVPGICDGHKRKLEPEGIRVLSGKKEL
jgi:hypothetical protein